MMDTGDELSPGYGAAVARAPLFAAQVDGDTSWAGSGGEIARVVFENFPGGIALIDAGHRMVLCNSTLKRMLDYPDWLFADRPGPSLERLFRFNAERGEYGEGDRREQVARRLALLNDRQAHVYERVRPDGSILEIRGTPVAAGGFVTTYFDVTEQRRAAALIAHMAHHDSLTDLPNRNLLMERLEAGLRSVGSDCLLAVHYLDLDGFKAVNDSLGHRGGDNLLIGVAQRLRSSVRANDLVARLGGDEFAVVQAGICRRSDAMALAHRIIGNLSRPFDLTSHGITIGVSVGISLAPINGRSAEELIIKADQALYRSKALGRGRFTLAL